MQTDLRNTLYYSLAASAVALIIALLLIAGCLPTGTPAGTPTQNGTGPAAPIPARYAAGEITRLNHQAEKTANASLNAIAAIPSQDRTVDNTLLAYDRVISDYNDAVGPLILMRIVYPDPAIAAEGSEVATSSQIFLNGVTTRRDLYDALKGPVPRTPDESRLYNETLREFEHNGLALPDDRLAKVRALRADLSAIESQYMYNLNNDNTTLEFTAGELSGVPAATIAGFKQTPQGTYLVTTKYPDYTAVMANAEPGQTRKKMYAAYYNRQAEANTPLLEQAIVLRQQAAQELGYATWADFRLDGRMAKNTANAMTFLTSLQKPLMERTALEFSGLLAIKNEIDPRATALDPWDIAYLQEIQKKRQYMYSDEEVRQYFPMDNALAGMFSIYGNLFGVRFDEVKGAPVWSPEVRLFAVRNISDNATVGYLYLDLYPREGKDGWFSESEVIKGRQHNGSYTVPVVAIVANFPAPSGDRPSLLTPYDLETLFHEGGHAMHSLLTTAPYGTMSGTSVEWDFIETPSQALEEWVWDPQVLESLSGHYTNTSRRIPPDLRDRVIAAHKATMGSKYSSRMEKSLEDMRFHTATGAVNVTGIWYQTYEEVWGIPAPAGTHQPASFDHVMDGYDAGYYSYLWSKVYALNIADTFSQDGMTNQTTGMKFRQEILARGNMADGSVLLYNFLGHEPGTEALYRQIGITRSQTGSGA
ncbi:M3 family metallopeptidase [Methanoregula formicica]|uniref:Zn-dependent oligopeptidase n=1 Tax=Methanoregula formicica (strain DSM 22288 / NBRC 105244 / SMSP) TaxID=593750 RepID=L0HBY6_METFS|nr:M3 family metallopeptidase [Methanoregula formicica]AGB02237.1 Zn-dependent oligopeptidase [Methanoregula formicica SMSP]